MKRRFNIIAGLAACTSLTGFAHLCYAQCDTSVQSGDVATTDGFDHSLDLDGDLEPDPDSNGGCNAADPMFTDLGTLSASTVKRIRGVVGNYVDATDRTNRDLDWCTFNMTAPGYITVSLSMSKDGVPFSTSGADVTQSTLFIAQGPAIADGATYCDDAATVFIYGQNLVGDCPQVAVYQFPNGVEASRIPMPAGRHMVIVTTPFNSGTATTYDGPIDYAVTMEVNALDYAVCGTSTAACTEAHSGGGCNDASCCDKVCGFEPLCCNVAWDQACVTIGVEECGLFVYNCAPGAGAPENDCAGAATFIDASVLPLTFGFDGTNASNDGPNNVNSLCSSNTTKDVWYVVGPLAYGGELRATMCDLGNTGDAVLSMYNLGTDSTVTDGSTLPEKYIGCRDDVCDDDGDGTLDFAGPAGITMIGVEKDNYYAIRVGTFLDGGQDPTEPAGLIGSLTVSFRATVFTNGLQKSLEQADGTGINLGWISGYANADNPKRWLFAPCFTTESASINGFDFAGYPGNATTVGQDEVNFKIIARDSAASDHGAFGRPFGNGLFNASAVLVEGVEPFDIDAAANVGDDGRQRYFVDLSTPFDLAPGEYYFTTYASNSGGANTSFAWFSYGSEGIAGQILTTTDNTTATDVPTTAVAGLAYGWRAVGTTPTLIAYQTVGDDDEPFQVQAGDPEGLQYQPAFSLKGDLANACFGDIDGSGVVDSGDIAFALLDFGPCPSCPSDLDGSGETDFGDIALILLSTGPCF
jgi:hypothetical protein